MGNDKLISRSAHQTTNFTNPEFQFSQFKVLQSDFILLCLKFSTAQIFDSKLSCQKNCQNISVIKANSLDDIKKWFILAF